MRIIITNSFTSTDYYDFEAFRSTTGTDIDIPVSFGPNRLNCAINVDSRMFNEKNCYRIYIPELEYFYSLSDFTVLNAVTISLNFILDCIASFEIAESHVTAISTSRRFNRYSANLSSDVPMIATNVRRVLGHTNQIFVFTSMITPDTSNIEDSGAIHQYSVFTFDVDTAIGSPFANGSFKFTAPDYLTNYGDIEIAESFYNITPNNNDVEVSNRFYGTPFRGVRIRTRVTVNFENSTISVRYGVQVSAFWIVTDVGWFDPDNLIQSVQVYQQDESQILNKIISDLLVPVDNGAGRLFTRQILGVSLVPLIDYLCEFTNVTVNNNSYKMLTKINGSVAVDIHLGDIDTNFVACKLYMFGVYVDFNLHDASSLYVVGHNLCRCTIKLSLTPSKISYIVAFIHDVESNTIEQVIPISQGVSYQVTAETTFIADNPYYDAMSSVEDRKNVRNSILSSVSSATNTLGSAAHYSAISSYGGTRQRLSTAGISAVTGTVNGVLSAISSTLDIADSRAMRELELKSIYSKPNSVVSGSEINTAIKFNSYGVYVIDYSPTDQQAVIESLYGLKCSFISYGIPFELMDDSGTITLLPMRVIGANQSQTLLAQSQFELLRYVNANAITSQLKKSHKLTEREYRKIKF